MLSIAVGPVALPVSPLLLALAVWIASLLASRLAAQATGGPGPAARSDAAGGAVVAAAACGLLAARLAHIAQHADAYLAAPAAMLDLRDGGWHALAGSLAAAACLAWRAWRTPAWRRPLAAATMAGLAAWGAGMLLVGTRGADELPAVALTTLQDARPMDLRAAAAGRPVVVNLWASWCGPCREEMPALAAAQQRERQVGILFVNQGESPQAVRDYLARLGMPVREVLLDPGSQLGRAAGSQGLPTTLFFDAQGRRVDAHFGVLNGPALESRLRRLRAGR